ncbi:glycosyltransferase [Thalassospira australica]|uniref:glycosyltransferase n=1 Tax=Thalassospira australica TaxID=1528106 RepID=UPI00384FF144
MKNAKSHNIVFFVESLKGGGTQRVVSNIITHWDSISKKIILVTLKKTETDFYLIPKNVQRICTGTSKRSNNKFIAAINNIKTIIKFREILKNSDCDAAISFLTSTNILTIIASIGIKKRIIISERSDPSLQKIETIWIVLRFLVYRFAAVVTANSPHAVKTMSSYVPKEKLCLIPNPIVLPSILARPRNAKMILNVGRLVPLKGQNRIIQAYLQTDWFEATGWNLTILGDGPSRDELVTLTNSQRKHNSINLPGAISNPNIFYQSAAMFVMASDYEGTPNALLEAMAHGLPCIVPDCLPGALEHVEHNISGLVYSAKDVTALKECMISLAQDSDLRERLGNEARTRMDSYSIDKIARQWEELLLSSETGKDANN